MRSAGTRLCEGGAVTGLPRTQAARGPGRPPRTAEARAAQRLRLLDGAMAAIRRAGPDASVEEMALEAGVSKPVLYAEFGDKHGIAEAIAVELVERSEQDVLAELGRRGTIDLAAALRLGIEGFIDIVTQEPEVYGFIVRSIRSNDKGLLDNALVRVLQARFELVAQVLAPDADPVLLQVIAHGTFGFVVGSIESWLASQAPPRDELVENLVAILASGLRTVGTP
jgi:AcrR family transcriptional regulator